MKLWEKLGAPKDKIVVGMGTYGRSFTLASLSNYGMNAPTSGGGTAGEFTKESGFLAFYEICQMMKEGATYFWVSGLGMNFEGRWYSYRANLDRFHCQRYTLTDFSPPSHIHRMTNRRCLMQ